MNHAVLAIFYVKVQNLMNFKGRPLQSELASVPVE